MSWRAQRLMPALAVTAGAVAVDQVVKAIVLVKLEPGAVVDVLGPFVQFSLVRNSGAAFSLGSGVTWIFTLLAACVFLGVLAAIGTVSRNAWRLSLGLFAGGVAGNLVDRLFRPPSFGMGHVIDFIRVPNFAVFNVADICITLSVAAMLILVLRGVTPNPAKTR